MNAIRDAIQFLADAIAFFLWMAVVGGFVVGLFAMTTAA